MRTVLFTKLFRGVSTEEMADHAAALGFDGIDLLVRNGHQATPDDPASIATAVRVLQASGLPTLMATVDLTDPASPGAEALLSGLTEAGIPLVRLGYWKYDPKAGYADGFDRARRDLDGLATLAQRVGIQLAIQLHGDTIHGSGAQTLRLLEGHDPAVVGAYPDPGNQTVQDGREDWRFTFDVLNPWLCCVGVKNGGWFPASLAPSGQRRWHADWLSLADGMVPWDDVISHLADTGYDGLLSLHSHYEVPLPQVLDLTRVDLNYVKRLIGVDASARVPAIA